MLNHQRIGAVAGCLLGTLVIAVATCTAQTPRLASRVLTNQDIVTLAKAGFTEDFIKEMIATSRNSFDVTASALADLAEEGITEDIMRAMRCAPAPQSPCAGRTDGVACAAAEHAQPAVSEKVSLPRVFIEAVPGGRPGSVSPTVEVMNSFARLCPIVTVTNRRTGADYIVTVQRQAGGWLRRDSQKIVVFTAGGNLAYGLDGGVDKSVDGFCRSVTSMSMANAAPRPAE